MRRERPAFETKCVKDPLMHWQVFCSIDAPIDSDAAGDKCREVARYARNLGFDVATDCDFALPRGLAPLRKSGGEDVQ